MGVKINSLEIENVKRVKAIKLQPSSSGLTIIGGKNGQGKTSVLDDIMWTLGGEKYRPSQAWREGSVIPPYSKIVLSNGIIVERKGKNSDLKVTDPDGKKAGQQLLNEVIEQLAIDLPKFMNATNKEKADTLLKIIGVGDKLAELEKEEQSIYNDRLAIGRIADQKAKFAKEMEYFEGLPKGPVSASELIKQQQDILVKNGENERKRRNVNFIKDQRSRLIEQENDLVAKLEDVRKKLQVNSKDLEIAEKSVLDLHDESTEALEKNIMDIENLNRKIRCNLDKEKAEIDAKEYSDNYDTLTAKLNDVRQSKTDLLKNADLPLPGLSVKDGELTYNGYKWDNMSGSEQLKVATAIVRKINPKCGFVLLDKLEQMDIDTLNEFGLWLESEGLQVIATRVSTGGECSIVIEDGYVQGEIHPEEQTKPTWKAGEF